MLYARRIPPHGGETEFCDTRYAYQRLPSAMRTRVDSLFALHTVVNSRALTGFRREDWDPETLRAFPPIRRPLVHIQPATGRKALCVASHIETIDGYTYEESQTLVNELIDLATGPGCVYTHQWRIGDLVLWNNLCTLHRARPYDEFAHVRDMRSLRTLDPTDA
jgi:alpha-ketoglutarate-dependent 2,4-dichlorophenoxyacetate dioxygenase